MAKSRIKPFCGDKVIWLVMIVLAIVSVVEVYSSIGRVVYDHDWSISSTIAKHVVLVALGFLFANILANLNYGIYRGLARFFFFFILLLLVYVFALYIISHRADIGNGKAAVRWIELPLIGQFQPSELAKYAIILYLANRIEKHKDTLKEIKTFFKLIAPVGLVCLFIFPENFSTAALVFIVCFLLMWIGGVNKKYLAITLFILLFGVGLVFGLTYSGVAEIGRSSTWITRVDDWLNHDDDALTQPNQAKMAIASGGFLPNGIGTTIQGRFLSESHTDFIYAVIIEELGSFIGILILLLYIWFFFRCMSVSSKSRTTFGYLLALGVGLLIFVQALVNMSVAVGYLPVTGQTLPLVSFGGTSYVITCCAIGMIQSVCNLDEKYAKLEAKKLETLDNSDNNNQNDNNHESNN